MATSCVLRADCFATRHDRVDRTQVPKHRHVLTLALSIFFGRVDITQCFAITALLSGLVTRSATFSSLWTLRTPSLLDLTSSCIHKYATSMCFNLPIPCLWRICSVVFASVGSTGFNNATIPLDSDAPNAAA